MPSDRLRCMTTPCAWACAARVPRSPNSGPGRGRSCHVPPPVERRLQPPREASASAIRFDLRRKTTASEPARVPTLAEIAVNAAKTAESSAQGRQFASSGMVIMTPARCARGSPLPEEPLERLPACPELFDHGADTLGRARRPERLGPAPICRGQQAGGLQTTTQLTGHRNRRVDDGDARPGDFSNQVADERIVRAPKDDRVGSPVEQRTEVVLDDRTGRRRIERCRFDLFDQARTRLCQHFHLAGVRADELSRTSLPPASASSRERRRLRSASARRQA